VADGELAVGRIAERFPAALVARGSYRDQHWAELALDAVVDVCRFLRDDPELDYDFLVDVTAVHWPGDARPFELVWHLYSYARNDRLRLKARAGDPATAPTLTGVWKSADWNEREVYDMFGVRFADHPDLRRILMPDDYGDFPLRKELPLFRG